MPCNIQSNIILPNSALRHFVRLVLPRVDVAQEHESVADPVVRAAIVAAAAGSVGGRGGSSVESDDGVSRVGEVAPSSSVGERHGLQEVGSLRINVNRPSYTVSFGKQLRHAKLDFCANGYILG